MTFPAAFLRSVWSSQYRRTFHAAAQLSSVAEGAVLRLMQPMLDGLIVRRYSFLHDYKMLKQEELVRCTHGVNTLSAKVQSVLLLCRGHPEVVHHILSALRVHLLLGLLQTVPPSRKGVHFD